MVSYSDKPWTNSYDKHVPAEMALPKITYLEFLEQGLYADQEKTAFYFMGSEYNYRQLNDLSDRFARFLVEKGCVKGDVVGVHLPNIPQFVIAAVGTLKAGCVLTGVSPLLTPKELAFQLNDCQAKVLVTLDILFQKNLMEVAGQIPNLKQIVVTNVADCLPVSKQFLGKLLKKIPTGKIVPKVVVSLEDTCLLLYTGGTTGQSKGAILTHRSVAFQLSVVTLWMDKDVDHNAELADAIRGKDIMCSGYPFFHLAGIALLLYVTAMGNTQILVPDPRNTDQMCKDMKKYKPTQIANVPTLYQLLLANPLFATIDFSSLKFALSAAAPFNVDSINKLESYVGKGKVVEVYGMTEGMISLNPVFGKKKIGSVGLPGPNIKVKIVDTENGIKEMPIGEPGEVIVCGPNVTKGYLNNTEATKELIREIDGDKYLYTGDVARMDEDGFMFIVDRTKDMLLVGGYNVYSKQIEECIYEIPEVEFCAIVGVPNPEQAGNEIVKAVIQLKDVAKKGLNGNGDALKEKITAHVRKNMTAYKVPKIVEFVDAIPLTAVGKVDKKVLRK